MRTVGALLLITSSQTPARAAGGAEADAYEGIGDGALEVHGLLDIYAQHALQAPRAVTMQFRAFDVRANTPALNLLLLSLAHRPDVFGFRFDAGWGDTANGYLRSDPAASTAATESRWLSYVHQGFLTVRLPGNGSATLDLGKFGTPIGIEDNETTTNWNYSRSLLFTLAEPTFHTGARATYEVTRELAVAAFWVNGWNTNLRGGNGMRSLGVAAMFRPNEALEAVVDGMVGPERSPTHLENAQSFFRLALDAYVTWALTSRWSFAATADYVHDEADRGRRLWGVGGYLRHDTLSWLSMTVRGEHLEDLDGYATGAPQKIAEVTLTIEARTDLGPVSWRVRAEARRDRSDVRAFDGPVSTLTNQDTIAVALIASF